MPAPYFFIDGNGDPPDKHDNAPSEYVRIDRKLKFPPSHRLAKVRKFEDMEPMRRELISLFVRCDYDFAAFQSFLNHNVRDLMLPFSSVHMRTSETWIYGRGDDPRDGNSHTACDFNDNPLPGHSYPDHPERTHFPVHAAASGTIVGWDETKLLTLEHTADDGSRYRTLYNMMRDVPVAPASGDVLTLGGAVHSGQRIGEAWNGKPAQPPHVGIHLHFAMFLPHTVPRTWRPDLAPLFDELKCQFKIRYNSREREDIETLLGPTPWRTTEWYPVDPFGLYDIFDSSHSGYGPVGRGFYYPVPRGVGPYAFRDVGINGDPGGDRIPLFAGNLELLGNLSVSPVSMATICALGE